MLIILSGPSGSGKDTILTELSKRDSNVQVSISLTTRPARDWEIDGFHYFFMTEEQFQEKLKNNEVLEYAKYGQNYYGTPKGPIDKWLEEGKTVILKIEVQGAEKIRKVYPDVISIFLMPPSMEVLEERLRCRESEDEEDIQRRLKIAKDEINRSNEYDYVVFNDVVDYAVCDLSTIIKAESLKRKRLTNKINEVMNNA
ncbi:MAG: guanylate kinase [Clostridiales bacterium]|nr:guanylate kinase [Clostridiales bacterium]